MNWSAAAGANLYTVKRSTLTYNGVGGTIPLNTTTLTNSVTGTTYTDTSVTNGSLYSYQVSASNAAGSGAGSSVATVTPVAAVPAASPSGFSANALQTSTSGSILLSWSAVPGAVGYVIQRATAVGGPYTFLATVSSNTYSNSGLAANTAYYYQAAAMNSGGTSAFVTASAVTPPAAPTNFVATPGNSKVTLSWTAPSGASSYVISRATVSGGPYTTIASGITSTLYQDATAANGTTYFYVVAATGAGGTGASSVEASTTPVGVPSLIWNGNLSSTWDTVAANWLSGGVSSAFANGSDVTFDDAAVNRTVTVGGTVTPNSVLFDNDSAYTFNAAGLSGPASFTKLGSGAVTISGANTYSGGTLIGGGSLVIAGAVSANGQNGLGTGPITLQGGRLTLNGYGGSTSPTYGNLSNPINVPAESSGTIQNSQRGGITGNLTGAGTLTLQVNYVRGDVGGDWSAFTGNIHVIRTHTGTSTDSFRIISNTGFGTAAINLGPYVVASNVLNASNTFTIGELSGDPNSTLAGIIFNNNTPGSFTATYVVGGRNTDAVFAGSITNGTSPSRTAITKEGSGSWTLSGTCSHTGPTLVNAGVLNLTGSLTTSGTLTVAENATLALTGGTITTTGAITNHGVIRISGAASLSNSGTFTNNGVLDLINGPQNLPANFINNGIVLDSGSVRIEGFSFTGSVATVSIQSHPGHRYQLQGTSSLSPSAWQNVGVAEEGDGELLTFSDSSPDPKARFYRVVVTSSP